MIVNLVTKNQIVDALAYMFEKQLPFVQARYPWTPQKKSDGKWVIVVCPSGTFPFIGDTVWDITVCGVIHSVTMTTGTGVRLFSWQAGQQHGHSVTVKLDVSLCLIKLGMTDVVLEIDATETPEVSALHVMYNDNEARRYEAQRPVVQGFSAISDLWDPVTQKLALVQNIGHRFGIHRDS